MQLFDRHVEVMRLLLETGADKNLADRCDRTALMFAAVNGHVEVMRLLREDEA